MITLKEYLKEKYPTIYHITITGKCNAFCQGCINNLIYGKRSSFLKKWESDPERDFKLLSYLLSLTNGDSLYLAFYGGEPFLSFKRLKILQEKILKHLSDKNLKFLIFTNGMLLDKVLLEDKNFFNQIDILVVSIDGRRRQHNFFRKGTDLRKIERNLRILRRESSVSVLMWSTLREEMRLSDCLAEFLKLLNQGLVDYFYWHLIEKDEPVKNFEEFKRYYFLDLENLFQKFIYFLRKGKVLPILPVCELIYFLAKRIRRGHTACGVERFKNFDLLGGKIFPCADLGEEFSLGEITKEGLIKFDQIKARGILDQLVSYKEALGCEDCEAEFYCGGRCPVLIKTSLKRAKQYCELTKGLVNFGKKFLPVILSNLDKNNLSLSQIYYPYGYLTLLTDVIP